MKKKAKVYAFLDSNIFLEYNEFTQIDWRVVAKSKAVCLVITRVNMQELDDFKYDPKSQRRQQRSRSVTKKILKIIKGAGVLEAQVPDRPNVSLKYLTSFPESESFPALRQNVNDDQMIASILEFKKNNSDIPSDDVVLITGDTGPQLLALHYDIQTIELAEEYQEQPEPNEIEKRLKKLEREFSELSQFPRAVLEVKESIDSLINVEQSKKNEKLQLVLSKPSDYIMTHFKRVETLFSRSSKTKPNRSNTSSIYSLPTLDMHRPLEINEWTRKPISSYLMKLDIKFNPALLWPVDIYTNGFHEPFYRPPAKGSDAAWHDAIYDLRNACEQDAEKRFIAISECLHYPLLLEVGNVGSVGMKEVNVTVTSNDFEFSRILPQFETPKSDRDKAAPAYKYLASDEKPEVYTCLGQLEYHCDLIRPKKSSEIKVGYIIAPMEMLSGTINIELSADNLSNPLTETIAIQFDSPAVRVKDEANFYKQLFDT